MTKRGQASTPQGERDNRAWLVSNAVLASIFVVALLVIGIFAPLRALDAPVPAQITDLSAAATIPGR
jgi:hypothetical protein